MVCRVERVRFMGQSRAAMVAPGFGRKHVKPGYAFRMSQCTAAMCLAQLEVIRDHVAQRDRMYRLLAALIGEIPGVTPLAVPDYVDVYSPWMFSMNIDLQQFSCSADEFAEELVAGGVPNAGTGRYYLMPVGTAFLNEKAKKKIYPYSTPPASRQYRYDEDTCPEAWKFLQSWIRWATFCEKYTETDCCRAQEVVAAWDSAETQPHGFAESFCREFDIPTATSTLEEMVDLVDGVIVITANWDRHIDHARPFVEAEKTVFIDKPMFARTADLRILQEWVAAGKRIIGGSSLRFAAEIHEYLALPEPQRGRPHTLFGGCGTDEFFYGIHGYSMLSGLMGGGLQSVRCLCDADPGPATILAELDWGDGRRAVLSLAGPVKHPFHITAVAGSSVTQMTIDPAGIYRALLVRCLPYLCRQSDQPPLPWEEFADERLLRFDHECLLRLADAGLPVPRHAGREKVGRFLARFHAALGPKFPTGKEGFVREDHPDLLVEYVDRLQTHARNSKQLQGIAHIQRQLDRVRAELDSGLYQRLPKAVIHGDIHQGNVAFTDSDVSAVYDFDYMSVQARARDLCDALMFFAGDRQNVLDVDDIRSLVQPFKLNIRRAAVLLSGYHLRPLNYRNSALCKTSIGRPCR